MSYDESRVTLKITYGRKTRSNPVSAESTPLGQLVHVAHTPKLKVGVSGYIPMILVGRFWLRKVTTEEFTWLVL